MPGFELPLPALIPSARDGIFHHLGDAGTVDPPQLLTIDTVIRTEIQRPVNVRQNIGTGTTASRVDSSARHGIFDHLGDPRTVDPPQLIAIHTVICAEIQRPVKVRQTVGTGTTASRVDSSARTASSTIWATPELLIHHNS